MLLENTVSPVKKKTIKMRIFIWLIIKEGFFVFFLRIIREVAKSKNISRLIKYFMCTNTLGKGMNPIILPPAMNK